jgi:hypothetical protein
VPTPAAGEEARLHEQREFEVKQALPDIRRLIQNDRIDEAIDQLGLPAGLRRALLSHT